MRGTKIFFYLYKTKLFYIFISLLTLVITVQIVDLIELTRININKENFSIERVLKMSFLRMPFLVNEILPFVIITSTSFFFKYLVDNNELISLRNIGMSIINIFYPVALAVFTVGFLALLILNPISSISMGHYQNINNENKQSNSVIELSGDNIWIKNKLKNKTLYLNAKNIDIKEMSLTQIMIIEQEKNESLVSFAKEGRIADNFLKLNDVEEIDIKKNKSIKYDNKTIKINFIDEDIVNSVQYYKHTPFYNYLNYSQSMKKLNYLTPEIILYFLSEIFKPLLLISVCFVVSGYVAKFKRNESFFKTIFIAIIIGFIMFLLDKLIYSINVNNLISYIIIIASIPIISIILGTIMFIRVEKN